MSKENKTHVTKDMKEKSILISRNFNAPLADVWRAYTESDLLQQWWAPAPWRAETKSMNFTGGGFWLYAMVSPEGQKHWGRMNYISIDKHKNFKIEDVFCDENGNVNLTLPNSKGQIIFTSLGDMTQVEFKMTYATEEALQQIIEMGFEQGITMCMDQLELYLSTHC